MTSYKKQSQIFIVVILSIASDDLLYYKPD